MDILELKEKAVALVRKHTNAFAAKLGELKGAQNTPSEKGQKILDVISASKLSRNQKELMVKMAEILFDEKLSFENKRIKIPMHALVLQSSPNHNDRFLLGTIFADEDGLLKITDIPEKVNCYYMTQKGNLKDGRPYYVRYLKIPSNAQMADFILNMKDDVLRRAFFFLEY